MKKLSFRFHWIACALAFMISPAQAAVNLGILGGVSLPGGTGFNNADNTSVLLGGELTFGLGDFLQLGGFYDHNFLKLDQPVTSGSGPTTSGTQHFYGAVGRLGIPATDFFADVKFGLTNGEAGAKSSDTVVGVGFGAGYRIHLSPLASFSPRVGYRVLPNSFSGTTEAGHSWDFTALIQLGL